MAKIEPCILTNMVMVYDKDGRILVQDRLDPDWPGITFPGGHVEPNESFIKSAIREVWEETGLTIDTLTPCGFKQFTTSEFRYIVMYFKTCSFSGQLKSSSEGKIFWIRPDELKNYKQADGFDEMLKVFQSDSLNENYGFKDSKGWQLENL